MSEFCKKYRTTVEKYAFFVTKNPLLASEIEVGLKWISYLLAGRFSQSLTLSEFIHSASRLLTLLNDSILRGAAGGTPLSANVTVEKLQMFLTVVDYIEVFVEVTSCRIGGSQGKWLAVIFMHLLKFTIRLILVLKYNQGLSCSPPVLPLDRQKGLQGDSERQAEETEPNFNVTFTLKKSGRTIRTLNAAPPLVSRTWKVPAVEASNDFPSDLSGKFLAAEMLHVCRPLAHLTSLGLFGEFSWKPYFLALCLDISSLRILRKRKFVNKADKQEMSRRALSLVLYLLRSPFYDRYSKFQIMNFRSKLNQVAGLGLLLRPLIEYIPEWQQQYFHCWSS